MSVENIEKGCQNQERVTIRWDSILPGMVAIYAIDLPNLGPLINFRTSPVDVPCKKIEQKHQ